MRLRAHALVLVFAAGAGGTPAQDPVFGDARWIRLDRPEPATPEAWYGPRPAPHLRKEFVVERPIRHARAVVTGLGYYELRINGRKVGDQELDPGWTDYGKRVLYSGHAVTDLVREGPNAVGLILGTGWYDVLPLHGWGSPERNLRKHLTVGRPRGICRIEILHRDGGPPTVVVTDTSWRAAEGPIVRDSVYLGEEYDARRELPGWDEAGFDETTWTPAIIATERLGRLEPQTAPPIRVTRTLRPVNIDEPKPGVFVFDFGEEFGGTVRLRVRGPRGATVSMLCGELLFPDGTVNARTSAAMQIKPGGARGGPGAPRDGFHRLTYTLKGEGEEVWQPRFTYSGFRWVEVSGFPGRPSLDALEGLQMNSSVASAGDFACSDETLNRIHAMCRRTFLSNLFSVQSDCPHREKFGYGGDLVATSDAFMWNFDMKDLYAKIADDFGEAQRPNGGFTETAPFVGIADEGLGDGAGPVGWGTALPLLCWQLFERYGDRQPMEHHQPAIRRWMDLLQSRADGYILRNGIGDHESLLPKDTAVSGTVFFLWNAELAARIAQELGLPRDAEHYGKLGQSIRAAFLDKLVDPATGRVGIGTQANQALALAFDLVPRPLRAKALRVLLDDLHRHDGHWTTGIFGTLFLPRVLSRFHRDDLVARALTDRTFPSLGFMLDQGATTLWETWAPSDNVYSRNHPMFGSVEDWFYESLAGLRTRFSEWPLAKPEEEIFVEPAVVPGITWMRARHRGVGSEWWLHDGRYTFRVYVPVAQRASVRLPVRRESVASSAGDSGLEPDPGFSFQTVYLVGPGTHTFTVPAAAVHRRSSPMRPIASLAAAGVLAFLGTLPGTVTAQDGSLSPARLRCEYLTDPLGIDVRVPRLSWELTAAPGARNRKQTAWQVQAAETPEALAEGKDLLWDSGKTASDATSHIAWGGAALASRQRVHWRVKVWDNDDKASAWSRTTSFGMGLLDAADWGASWIGDARVEPRPRLRPAHNGYHSEMVKEADQPHQVTIDLGEAKAVDGVRLHPSCPHDRPERMPGYLFPPRFKVEVAAGADFAGAAAVVDRTAEDFANPGTEAAAFPFGAVTGRYVRLTATRLAERPEKDFAFALAEMEVLAGGTNVALGKTASATSTVERSDWGLAKLTDGDTTSHKKEDLPALPPPMLRKAFDVAAAPEAITRATLYITALGLYEARLNGQKIGDRRLAPEWTDYLKRVQYQTYDVTGLVKPGANVLGAMLGDGWYAGRLGLTGIVPGGDVRAIYGRHPRLLCRLEIERADGSWQKVVSDGSWRATRDGPVRVADLLEGEIYDARQEIAGWDAAGFDDAAWSAAGVFEGIKAAVVAQRNEPIRAHLELKPAALTEPAPGVHVFDLGQNFAGVCRLKVRAPAGTTVTLRHAEVLNPDGTIYTTNLRGPFQIDRYTCRGGDGVEVFEPRFTYHGFRYVEVTGLPAKPETGDLTGIVFNSAPPEVGTFSSASPILDRLMQNVLWTQRANMMSTPTDCPQRDERMGWTGDILAFAQTACFNMDMAAFYTKWLQDMRDAQTEDGRYPDFAPQPFDPAKRFSSVPAWGDAGVFVPWVAYRNYGDARILEEHFDSARRWVEYVHAKNPELLWKHGRGNDYGDWLNADTLILEGWPKKGAEMPKEAFGTAFFARSTEIVGKMAAVLGKAEDAERYAKLAGDIRAAFQKAYVKPDGSMEGDTQAGYAIALHFGLVPDEVRKPAAARMVERFKPYDGHISTGFHSTICLMHELTNAGYLGDAWRLVNNRTMPSWGYAIDHGATTIWERWDGYVAGRGFQNPGMNSFSHYALGSVGEWVYTTVAGIALDPEVPAWKRSVIRPRPGGGVTRARGACATIHGRIGSEWEVNAGRITLTATVPPNTTATIHVPTTDPKSVKEGGKPAGSVPGLLLLRTEDDAVVFEAGSGAWRFEAAYKSGDAK